MSKAKEEIEKTIGKGRTILRYAVNYFLYTLIGIMLILMLVFTVSQTSVFKDWLRNFIVSTVNEDMNGQLKIGKLEGTIFTSVILKNISIVQDKDTVISSEHIEIKISPLKLFFKVIYARKIELRNTAVNLKEDRDGNLNIATLFKPSDEEEDTTSAEFPFAIQVSDLELVNFNFLHQTFQNISSLKNYPSINADDLRIKNLNLSVSALAEIKKNSYSLEIHDFAFEPNFKFFNLKKLRAKILASPKGILISDFLFESNDSHLELNLGISDVNLFGDFSTEELSNAPIRIQATAEKFDLNDLSTFIADTNFMLGLLSFYIDASGTLNSLQVDNLNVQFNKTSLRMNGQLTNVLDFDNFYINANFNQSVIDPVDAMNLMPSIGIPAYEEFGSVIFDTLTFEGNPINFNSKFSLKNEKGSKINGTAQMDLRNELAEYNIVLNTTNFNIAPFAQLPSNLNSTIKIKGKGFDPANMSADISVNANRSAISNYTIDNLKFTANAAGGKINSVIELNLEEGSEFNLISEFGFDNPDDPTYSIKGNTKNLNIGKLINYEDLNSNLNIDFEGEGQGFDPDSLDLFLVLNVDKSRMLDIDIDSTAIIADVRRNDNGKKIINIISDLADLTISGQYSVTSLADVTLNEIDVILNSFEEKYGFLYSAEKLTPSKTITLQKDELVHKPISLEYLLEFKRALTINLGDQKFEFDGVISGELNTVNDSLIATIKADFDYLKLWMDVDFYFLTKTRMDFEFVNKVNFSSIDELKADLNFRTNRMYVGANVQDLNLKLKLNSESIDVDFSGKFEDYLTSNFKAQIKVDNQKLNIQIDSARINYNNLRINNNLPLTFTYENEKINIQQFLINFSNGEIALTGSYGFDYYDELLLSGSNINWRPIGKEVFEISDSDNFDATISFNGSISGDILDPLVSMDMEMADLVYQERHLGSILSSTIFRNGIITTDNKFIDSVRTISDPKLTLTGTIPFIFDSLDENGVSGSLNNGMNLVLNSESFDLSSLGNSLPYLNNLSGVLNSNILITGQIDNPLMNGYLNVDNSSFRVEANNIKYQFGTDITFADHQILVNNISIRNEIGIKNGGSVNGNGTISFNEYSLTSADLKFKGDLKILDKDVRVPNPVVYGDLAIETEGEIYLAIDGNNTFIDIPINVTVADLIFPLTQTAYQNTSDFIYRFPSYIDSSKILEVELDSLIKVAEENKIRQSLGTLAEESFNYRIKVNLKTEAKMVVPISKEINQNLTAVMKGNFQLISTNGRTISNGKLDLLEGSKLTFIKTFEARGNVRIENLENPLLDILATYKDYYYPSDTTGASEEIEVAVVIRFEGPLNELSKNFVKDEQNISVYVGTDNIASGERDPTKNASDAFMFIIAGKFTDGATTQDQNAAASTAANLAGSVLGGFLNRYLGDYVRSVQLRQVGTATRFSLMGKAGDFRYEIGGSTEVFQNISRANVRIEYPIIKRLLFRLERKESISETTLSNDMFNELGIKYRFEF